MFRNARVADYRSPAWETWRERERDSVEPMRHCGGCGFVHRRNNHAPRREEERVRADSRAAEMTRWSVA